MSVAMSRVIVLLPVELGLATSGTFGSPRACTLPTTSVPPLKVVPVVVGGVPAVMPV